MDEPWPGLAIVLIVMGLTLTGESLNDLAYLRLRSRRRAKAGSGTVADTAVTSAVGADHDIAEPPVSDPEGARDERRAED